MATVPRHSKIRDGRGPRVIEGTYSRERNRHISSNQIPRKASAARASKTEHSHRRRGSYQAPLELFDLDVIEQPLRHVVLGSTIDISVLISLRTSERGLSAHGLDTSRLLAVTSLVSDNRQGDRVPLEAGTMTGQKMFDSVHPIPEHCSEGMDRNQPCRTALGYSSFPGLLVRQPGIYRVRTTLISMSASSPGGTSVAMVDSDVIKVERRPGNTRRSQR
ncbi:hypothetical protein K431DRAFT_289307 [Polychaeton citri CBS 116435]|uniref:Velvet domain-containing protein n=1 Tax=Polychaeton citri CBS 116435 TaxID=1314669 RepID=A0A9P4PZ81_9PEZI|nr:hypothetical protein K431DRAFT_289307 [Polychaeton citri CBS 116435]